MDKAPKITKEEIMHIAKLANLTLTDRETEIYQQQLSKILDYINLLNEVDTKDTKETSQVTEMTNVTRPDKINPERMFTQKAALQNATKTYEGYFVVPAVIEKE
jgi:aspartyl-tRNA(Asn)/glutamyl-tRNA(Gln) amidotransferase subunit C